MQNTITENLNTSTFENRKSFEEIKTRLHFQEKSLQNASNNPRIIGNILNRNYHRRLVVSETNAFFSVDSKVDVAMGHSANIIHAHHACCQRIGMQS